MLLGFGIFNTVEGIIDHHLLGIHHVNETVAREVWAGLGHSLHRVGCGDDYCELDGHARRTARDATMIRAIPPAALRGLFAAAAVPATFPIWCLWLFGFHPTLNDLLWLRCFGV
jgi:Predicted membrane protein (DUF2243)